MKVWLVNHYALPPQRSGGTRHYSLARGLIRRGHDVTLIASSVDYMRSQESHLAPGEPARLEIQDEVPFLWLRTPPYQGNSLRRVANMLAFARRVRTVVPRRLARPDVIVGSTPHLFGAWAAYRLARRLGVPFVLEVRDLWPQTLIDLGGFSPYHPFILLLAALERTLYRRAHAIVSLLPGGPDYIAQKVGRQEGVFWIPNGVDFSLIPDPVPPPPGEPFVVMYAGAHGLANGLDVALAAARQLQQQGWGERVQFRFVGDGPEKARLMAQAAAWRLTNVQFEPLVSKAEIYHYLQEAGAFLLIVRKSSLYQWGFSMNKLFDYLAMARPIIISNVSKYNPVKKDQAGIVVPPDDPDALARAIQQLAQTSPEERWAMGLRGRAYVEQEHNLDRLAERLEQVLQYAQTAL